MKLKRIIAAILLWALLFFLFLALVKIIPLNFKQYGVRPIASWKFGVLACIYALLYVSVPLCGIFFRPRTRVGLCTLCCMLFLYVAYPFPSLLHSVGLPTLAYYVLFPSLIVIAGYFVIPAIILISWCVLISEKKSFLTLAFLFVFAWPFQIRALLFNDNGEFTRFDALARLQRWIEPNCPTIIDIGAQPSLFTKCTGFTSEKDSFFYEGIEDRNIFKMVLNQLLLDIPATDDLEMRRRAVFAIGKVNSDPRNVDTSREIRKELAPRIIRVLCNYPTESMDSDMVTIIGRIFQDYKQDPGIPEDCPIRSSLYMLD